MPRQDFSILAHSDVLKQKVSLLLIKTNIELEIIMIFINAYIFLM